MKINGFLSLMAFLLAVLIGYLVYTICGEDPNSVIGWIVTSITMLGTLVPLIGLQYTSPRISLNIKALTTTMAILFLAINIIYAVIGIRMPSYVIINSILLVLYLIGIYRLIQISDV
ncbi:MAG: hypothetical protein K2H18_01355 [Muribaculaceae bacterium]|nr:hypothetical protein [Muribaculaceae bacterium]